MQARHLVEKMAFVGLGVTKNEVDNLYEELVDNEKVINALIDRAAEENVTFPLKETVDTVLYELKSAAKAHVDWQPSKVTLHLQSSKVNVIKGDIRSVTVRNFSQFSRNIYSERMYINRLRQRQKIDRIMSISADYLYQQSYQKIQETFWPKISM